MSCDPDALSVSSGGGFSPAELDLGEIGVGEFATGEVELTSGGGGSVRAVRFIPDEGVYGAFLATSAGVVPLLGAEIGVASAAVEIRFGPAAAGEFDADMEVELEDRSYWLPLRADAASAARLGVEPKTIDFGGVALGFERSRELLVQNQGQVPGRLVGVEVMGDDFELPYPTLPLTLGPGDELRLRPRYRPTRGSSHDAGAVRLVLERGEATSVSLVGRSTEGTPTLRCPELPAHLGQVARGQRTEGEVVCERLDPGWRLASWRLDGASEPGFEVVEEPRELEGDRVAIRFGFDARGRVGLRRGDIDLIDPHGLKTRATVTATIVTPGPGEADLFVELSWDTAEGDLDLHLVRDGGRRFDGTNDCYFASKNPDWGAVGVRLDDPFLDRDDREGFGPEQIALVTAAETAYDVFVQLHDDTGILRPPTATVTWNLRGGGGNARARVLHQCGDGWWVGRFEREGSSYIFVDVDRLDRDFVGYAHQSCR